MVINVSHLSHGNPVGTAMDTVYYGNCNWKGNNAIREWDKIVIK